MFSLFFLCSLTALFLASIQDLKNGWVFDFTWILLAIPYLNKLFNGNITMGAIYGMGVGVLLLSVHAGMWFKGYLGGADWLSYLALLTGLGFSQWLLGNLLLGLFFTGYFWYVKIGRKENEEKKYFVVHLYLCTLVATKAFYFII